MARNRTQTADPAMERAMQIRAQVQADPRMAAAKAALEQFKQAPGSESDPLMQAYAFNVRFTSHALTAEITGDGAPVRW